MMPGFKSMSKIKLSPKLLELNQVLESGVISELGKDKTTKSTKPKTAKKSG